MLPFSVQLKPGSPVSEQVRYAVRRAIVSGRLKPGERFPSVRQISQELGINPNTAHKIMTTLINEGLLVATPAVGAFVAEPAPATKRERAGLLGHELEWIAVEAGKLGVSLDELKAALEKHWEKLSL